LFVFLRVLYLFLAGGKKYFNILFLNNISIGIKIPVSIANPASPLVSVVYQLNA
jgi:hypothetical protein